MSKFYTLNDHTIRKSAIVAVANVTKLEGFQSGDGTQHGFYIYLNAVDCWWIGYDGEDMAIAQRAKLMEALEEGND